MTDWHRVLRDFPLVVMWCVLAATGTGAAWLTYDDATHCRERLRRGAVPRCIVRLDNGWCWTIAASGCP